MIAIPPSASPVELLMCPNCGRKPALRDLGFIYAGNGAPSRYVIKLECRKWFGLRLCFGAHRATEIAKDWFDTGIRHAVQLWNEAVIRAKEARR